MKELKNFKQFLKEGKRETYSMDISLSSMVIMLEDMIAAVDNCEEAKDILIDIQLKLEEAKTLLLNCGSKTKKNNEEDIESTQEEVDNVTTEPSQTQELQTAEDIVTNENNDEEDEV